MSVADDSSNRYASPSAGRRIDAVEGLGTPDVDIELSPREVLALERIAERGSPGRFRFPDRLERQFQAHVRQTSRLARVSLAVMTVLLYLVAPMWTALLLESPESNTLFILVLELGVMAPLFGLVGYLLWRHGEREWAEWLMLGAFAAELVIIEWLRYRAELGGYLLDPSLGVLVPVAIVLLARIRILRALGLVLFYAAVVGVRSYWWPSPHAYLHSTAWLLQSLLLVIVLMSAIWSKLSFRRQWAANMLVRLMAYRDSLTGLPNRRAFETHHDVVSRALSRSPGTQLVLALIDIDHFKKINDLYGHEHGDGVLAEFSLTLAQAVRSPMDMVARLGGDEFVLLLCDCDEAEARQRLTALVTMVRELQIDNASGKNGILTCTIGAVIGGPKLPLYELYKAADESLYQAKRDGRDDLRLVRADDPAGLSAATAAPAAAAR